MAQVWATHYGFHFSFLVRLGPPLAIVDMGALERTFGCLGMFLALANPTTAGRHGLVRAKHNLLILPRKTQGVFSMVMQKWQAFPNTDDFAKSCAEGLDKLLPDLSMQYTAHQVPIFLHSECDVWVTKKGFAVEGASLDGDEYTAKSSPLGWSEGEKTLARARTSCEHCAKLLGDEFFGKKDYLGWCKNVTGFLQKMKDLPQLRGDIANLHEEHRMLSAELDALRINHHEARHKIDKMGKVTDSWWKRWVMRRSQGSHPVLSLLSLSLAFLAWCQ